MKLNLCTPPNIGWIETRLDKNHIDFLWKRIKEKKEDNYKKNLAGNISQSFEIEDKNDYFFKEVLSKQAELYFNTYGKHPVRDHSLGSPELKLHGFWVNYQNKHEVNPYHHHGGVYSFAIWIKIPYNWKEQNKLSFLDGIKEDDKKAGIFEFEYHDILGGVCNYGYRLEPSMEGCMVFFPAALRHTVYPFYNTDESRVSVAGNLWFK